VGVSFTSTKQHRQAVYRSVLVQRSTQVVRLRMVEKRDRRTRRSGVENILYFRNDTHDRHFPAHTFNSLFIVPRISFKGTDFLGGSGGTLLFISAVKRARYSEKYYLNHRGVFSK
jgi:hypothetical protein